MKQNFAFKKIYAIAAGTLLLAASTSHIHAADDLKPIFTGTNLAGWKVPETNPFWKIVDGVLVGENDEKLKGHVLYTEQSYTNFVLELEVRWSGEIDSGVMMREPEIQVQFGISRSLKRDMPSCCRPLETQERSCALRPAISRFAKMNGTISISTTMAIPML